MNKFVLSALALTTAGGMAYAGSGSEEWLTLDREIESLASTLAPQGSSGFTVGGFLRSSYVNSGDVVTASGNDLGGFSLDNTRVNLSGSVGDFNVFMSADTAVPGEGGLIGGYFGIPGGTINGGTLGVLDAYAGWNFNEQFMLTMGQFRSPFLAGSQLDENHLLFLDRDFNSTLFAFRDQGVMLNGDYDQFGWAVAVQNGTDSTGDDLAYSAHVAFHAMGSGSGMAEGAYGNTQDNTLNVSAGYYQDDDTAAISDLSAFNLAADFRTGPLYAGAQYVDYDFGAGGDASPYMLVVSWMFVPDQWEAGIRYEDLDTPTDTTLITIGVNYYMQGHDAKWQLNYASVSDDVSVVEADLIGIGLTTSV